jgi:ubiquinone/menaquinone biosynthesis C-methylase UbiE
MEIIKLIKFLACPNCGSNLQILNKNKLICTKCFEKYQIIKGIPILISQNTLGIQEKKQTIWFNKHYSQFDDKYSLENWRKSMIKRIFNQNIFQVKNYLDIGCGATGYTAIEAAKQNNWLSFGVDISLEAMVKANQFSKTQGVYEKTSFIVASAQNLPFKKNLFDYISAISILEHLDNDKKAIIQINKILKDKRYLFICVPNSYLKIWFFIWPFYLYNDINIGHKRHYSVKKLNQLLTDYHLNNHFYNGHLIKFIQLFLEKLKIINNKNWWKIENIDINHNSNGVQLNALYQKK